MSIFKKIFILLSFVLLFSTPTYASLILVDDADILTPQEETDLLIYYNNSKFVEESTIDVIIYSNLLTSTSHESNAHNFYEDNAINENALMLYVNMSDRYIDVSSYGELEEKVTPRNCTTIYNKIMSYFSDDNYLEGCKRFLDEAYNYSHKSILLKFSDMLNYIAMFSVNSIIFIVIAIAVSLCSRMEASRGVKRAKKSSYVNRNESSTEVLRVDYTYTETRKTRRSTSSSGSSSGSGGGSHGGGHF